MNSKEKRLETQVGAAKKSLQEHMKKWGGSCPCKECEANWNRIRKISEAMNGR